VILGVLQARMSSSRLPGKVLRPLAGAPMILRIVERISRSQELDGLVVVTSTDPSDDALVDVLAAAGVAVRRGSLDDVLSGSSRSSKNTNRASWCASPATTRSSTPM
jgi:spore coat polysaccharide biosynthesis protein SpsF